MDVGEQMHVICLTPVLKQLAVPYGEALSKAFAQEIEQFRCRRLASVFRHQNNV
jgi:hypothetical protein